MQKLLFTLFFFTSLSIAANDMPDRFLGQSVQAIWQSIHTNINSFFIKEESPKPESDSSLSTHESKDISAFQKLFRQTITFTNNTSNSLSLFAQNVINETEDKLLTAEQAANKFIDQVEEAGTDIS